MFDLCFSSPYQHPKPPLWGRLGVVAPQAPGVEVSPISTDDTFRKFYYNPQREHLRSVLGDKLPNVLTGRKPVELQEHKGDHMKDLVAQFKGLTKAERTRLMKMIEGAS